MCISFPRRQDASHQPSNSDRDTTSSQALPRAGPKRVSSIQRLKARFSHLVERHASVTSRRAKLDHSPPLTRPDTIMTFLNAPPSHPSPSLPPFDDFAPTPHVESSEEESVLSTPDGSYLSLVPTAIVREEGLEHVKTVSKMPENPLESPVQSSFTETMSSFISEEDIEGYPVVRVQHDLVAYMRRVVSIYSLVHDVSFPSQAAIYRLENDAYFVQPLHFALSNHILQYPTFTPGQRLIDDSTSELLIYRGNHPWLPGCFYICREDRLHSDMHGSPFEVMCLDKSGTMHTVTMTGLQPLRDMLAGDERDVADGGVLKTSLRWTSVHKLPDVGRQRLRASRSCCL